MLSSFVACLVTCLDDSSRKVAQGYQLLRVQVPDANFAHTAVHRQRRVRRMACNTADVARQSTRQQLDHSASGRRPELCAAVRHRQCHATHGRNGRRRGGEPG